MQMHRMQIVVPEDHRIVVELPETIRSGPVELIVLVPSEPETAEDPAASPEARARWQTLVRDLEADPRPFRELSRKERRARLERIMGAGRGLSSTSEEFARGKLEEIELEERKFAR